MSSSGAHRRLNRPALVLLQLLVFVTYIFGPTATLGEEPTPEPTPVETIAPDPTPEPSAEPTPSEEPATEEPSAPASEEPSTPPEEPSAPAEPTIWTGKDDYVPTEWVDIYGAGWNPGESVDIFVDDHKDRTWSHTATAAADEFGGLIYEFRLPSWFVATYTVTATGDSGRVLTTTFADSVAQGGVFFGSNSGNGAASQQLTLSVPAIAAGEVAIAQVVVNKDFQNRLICPPSGWTSILKTFRGSNLANAVYVQESFIRTTAAAAQSQDWQLRTGNCSTGTLQNGFGASGGVIVYSGVDTTNPVRSAVGANGPSGDPKNAPGTGAAAVGDMVVRLFGNEKNETIGPSATRIYSVGSSNQQPRAAAAFAATHASGATAGTFSFTGSTGEWTAQTVVLRMGGASKLAFTTSAHTGAVSDCLGPITVQTQDASNAAANMTADTVINLSTDGAGSFHSDSACATAAVTSQTIATGGNSTTFYYQPTARGDGTHLLTASATGLTSATQTQTVNKADPVITWDDPAAITYGTALSATQLDATADVAGSFDYTPAAGTVLDAGTHTLSVEFTPTNTDDYNTVNDTASLTVNAKNLTIDGAVAEDKVYDGGTDATVDFTDAELVGVVGTDDVAFDNSGYLASFADENVGTDKAVTVTGVILTGDDIGNYTLSQPSGLTADITPLGVTLEGAVAENKEYDGGTGATVDFTDAELVGVQIGDDLDFDTSGYSASFEDKHVGTDKAVTVSGITLTGDDADNYTLTQPVGLTAEITARSIEVTADAGQTKVYGDADPLPFTYTITDGELQGDDDFTGALERDEGEDVGLYTINQGTLAIDDGNGGLNYTLSFVTDDFSITPKDLTVDFTVLPKMYDGTKTAEISSCNLTGVINLDDVGCDSSSATAEFEDRHVGEDKLVTAAGFVLNGSAKDNYQIAVINTAEGTISRAPLSINAVTDSKTYDGTTSSGGTPLAVGLMSGDTVTGAAQAFTSKNVLGANGSTLTVTTYTVNDGNGGGNYTVTTNTATGTISRAPLSINAVTDSKTYDGTTSSGGTPLAVGLMSGDTVTGAAQAFTSKNVLGANGSTLTVTTYTVNDGNGGDNYTVTTNTATGTISPKDVIGSFTAADKLWDGTTAATVTSPLLSGVITGDFVDLGYTGANFASSTIGTWPVTLTDPELTGADAGNYNLASIDPESATIHAAYTIEGFFRPVDMTPVGSPKLWNPIKGGSTVPLKFRVYSAETGEEVTTTAGMSVRITKIQCTYGTLVSDDIAPTTGSTSLRYDTLDGQFVFNWATPKGANICYEAYVQTADGATQMAGPGGTPLHDAFFRTK